MLSIIDCIIVIITIIVITSVVVYGIVIAWCLSLSSTTLSLQDRADTFSVSVTWHQYVSFEIVWQLVFFLFVIVLPLVWYLSSLDFVFFWGWGCFRGCFVVVVVVFSLLLFCLFCFIEGEIGNVIVLNNRLASCVVFERLYDIFLFLPPHLHLPPPFPSPTSQPLHPLTLKPHAPVLFAWVEETNNTGCYFMIRDVILRPAPATTLGFIFQPLPELLSPWGRLYVSLSLICPRLCVLGLGLG